MSLEGASVLVTGGTRGIGRAIALRLVADGAARAVLGYMRNDTAAEEAAALVEEAGGEAVLVRGNVADARTVDELAAAGPYRVVVHNAATGVIRAALETEDKHWDWTLAANARALLSLARATVPAMKDGGSILAISSLGAQRVLPNYVLVGTSKAALESVVRYLAFDLAPRGIRVNSVPAGAVATGVDARPGALETARERWPKILWVDGNPQSLPRQLRRHRFDLVYSGEGVLGHLDDLAGWATGIAAALREHGELLVFDDHPVADCVDAFLHWRNDYFRDPADPDRLWRIGQVVSALVRADLRIEALEEYPGGTARRRHDRRIPATFLLYARRA